MAVAPDPVAQTGDAPGGGGGGGGGGVRSRPGAADEPRSARKRRAILEAATAAFLANGYRGTSMDEIAAQAAVSKQTVYKHFSDKATLFAEIVTSTVDRAADPVHREVLELQDSGSLETDLRDLARRQLLAVMQPQLLALRRLIIGESGRFPALGRLFYERGQQRTIEALAAAFERLAARGELAVDDPGLAAQHFNWLIMAMPLNRAMLLGDDEPPPPAELDRHVAAGVRAFLAAYGPR